MNTERLVHIIVAPHISEKSTQLSDTARQFVFQVVPNAKKTEIKQAIEYLFKVKVKSVHTCNVQGKKKVFKRIFGRRKNWKKAYVALKEGYDINFAEAEK